MGYALANHHAGAQVVSTILYDGKPEYFAIITPPYIGGHSLATSGSVRHSGQLAQRTRDHATVEVQARQQWALLATLRSASATKPM